MKLRLPLNRTIGTGLVALCAGLAWEAEEQLQGLGTDPVEAVHRSRVALKRARSVLRLLEKAGASWAIMPRFRLTQLAGRMSAARDVAVSVALANKLARRLKGGERAVALMLAAKKGSRVPPEAAKLRQALLQEARELALAPAPVITPAQLRSLLRRCLDRTMRRYQAAVVNPTLESVHEWRKAVIVLRDQSALAAVRWPEGAGIIHPLLVRFARQLGRRGDVAQLMLRLQHLRMPPALGLARQRLLQRLGEQRDLATLDALVHWLSLERRLVRQLAEE